MNPARLPAFHSLICWSSTVLIAAVSAGFGWRSVAQLLLRQAKAKLRQKARRQQRERIAFCAGTGFHGQDQFVGAFPGKVGSSTPNPNPRSGTSVALQPAIVRAQVRKSSSAKQN